MEASVECEAGGSCCLQPETEELKEELKMEEIKYLWSQLDGAQTSWQELSEIKEQLLVRTSYMEEMECLKKDYQIKWDKKRIEHENELEQLRLYFEQKLKTVEENYREELTMLHQRLQEVKDSFLPEMENSQDQHVEFGPSMSLLEDMTEKERYGLFEQLTLQLEHYKEELSSLQLHLDKKHREEIESLKCSLKLHYQESLMKMKMDLSEKYISEIEELKRKHCLNLEELRARISEEHLREIAKLGLQNAQDAARQIETKVAEQLLVLEDEYKAKHHHVQAEMQLFSIQQEEIEKLRRENADLKKMSVWQEMHLKHEFEQIEDKTKSLRDEMEDASGKLKDLRQREEKENRGGEIPTAVLRSDIKLCINEKEKFLESYQQMLKLLLKMVKAIKDTGDLIYKKTGNYSLASEDSGENQFMIGELVLGEKSTTVETWRTQKSDRVGQGKFLNQTLPEHSFASLMADEISELSEHLCESIFENQDLVLENEEQIHKICHGLRTVVEKLLDQLAESTKQLEEMHTVNIHIEEDFKGRRWQVRQIVNDPHEPMDCFNEENKVNSQLVLELHKTKGFMEGCLAERYALEEALKLKEESEFRLVLELEALKAQIQELTQELARSAEEQKLLTNQNKALAASIGEREADLVKKIEHLAKAKLEVECQTEKDRSTLNAHVEMLEMELEEELNKNQNLAVMSLEVTDLKQQMQALERKLKNQRDFMDKQAAEREHERDEFQEEIQKLEMELKLTAKLQASGHSKADLVESLQNEIKEKTEDYNRLFLDRERIQKELVVRNEEIEKLEAQIRELECRNEEQRNNVNKLSQEMKEMEAELKQENIEKLAMQSQNPGESELVILQFLKSLVEEKNQETDHLNEQIMRLEYTIENREGNEILENKVLEIQDTKSIIEHLHGDKEQLLRDKTQEVKQLNRVTEKLQKELVLLAPMCQKADDRQDTVNSCAVVQPEDNFLNETKKGSLVNRGEKDCTSLNPNKKQFQGQLEIAMADREALQQLLEEEKNLFKTEVKILEQNLQNVQQSSTEHFTKLTALQLQYEDLQEEHKLLKRCLTYTQTELRICSARIQELEDCLQDRQAMLSEKELQLQRVLEQKAVEIQHVKENVELENELYILTQTLHEKEAIYQRQISELQLAIGELKLQVEKKVEELEALRSERDLFYSQLKSYIETAQDNNQKETKLHKVGLKLDTLVHFEEKDEGKEERKAINIPSISAVPSYGDKLEKNTITHLKMSSKNHNIQDKHLQSKLFIQEEKITTEEQQDLQLVCQEMWQLNQLSQNTQFIQKMPDRIQNIIIDETAWDSPEILRKENSMALWSNLAVTPFSEVDSMHSIDSESLCSEHPIVPSDILGIVEWPASYCNDNEETAASFIFRSSTTPGPTFSVSYYSDVQENISVRNAEDLTLMPLTVQDDLRTNMSKPEGASIEYVSNASSDLAHPLHQENKETTLLQDDSVMAYLQCLGMVPDISETAMKEKEMFSEQLKHVLDMVYEESHKILVLSEKSRTPDGDKKNIQKTLSIEAWQRERLILLDSVQSLKDYFSKVPHEEDRENVSAFFDWSGELLQAIQCVLEMQQNMCQSYLQSHSHSPGSGDKGLLVEKLQHIIEQQEQQEKIILEHLLSSDRKILLTKIKDLEAQLRLLYLQSQEKLQQLQEMLINTENRGNKQEHQLRRQVELLEYKLQQEKSIASDLQASLKIEQVKASQMHDLLKQEGAAIFNLKSDLCESKQANEQLQKSLQELQKEIVKYSSVLENKEMAMTAILHDLENEKCKEKELQNMLDEQMHQHKRREDEKSKAIEELQAALELQCIQNNQFSVALEHEQSANSNLRKELQIEHSRCEALLSQEQNKLLELQKNIELEKKCNLELLSALNHERVLTEQLSMRINECSSCKHKDSLQELQVQLYRERSHARELLTTIEKTQQQVLGSKKMGEIQMYSEEPQKNQELHVTLGLQNKEQEIQHALEIQRKKEAQMKKEWGQLQLDLRLLRDQENRTEQTRRDGRHKQHTFSKLKEMQDARESQWKCNTGRIEALQQMVRDLKEQRKYFNDHRNQHKPPPSNKYANICSTTDTIDLHEEQKKLQNIREQLLSAAAYLSEFVYTTVDKTINWPASSDETIATLLNILELEAELSTSFKPVGEKPDLQNCIKATEYEATKHNLVMENKSVMASCNLKMQKLYRKYLRAESFRKALVYQKKYLLLLLGGFQECEQATLSLIARMGIYPSPPDLNVSESRGYFFIKFRSAVRVIIAISRLKFLVKKWHKVSKKGLASESISPSAGHSSYLRTRVEALKQPLPIDASQEAGYCNINGFMGLTNCSPQSSHFFHDRSTSSAFQVSSKDPEQSLTDYVARLETIQQRLGILMLGQAPQQESL